MAFSPVSLLASSPDSLIAQTSLTLDSCLQLARENNASIRRAQLEVERAEQVRMQALTKYFPQVQATAVGYHSLKPIVDIGVDDIANPTVRDLLLTLYGNYGAALGLDNTLSLFQHGVTAGVTAIQPVFMGGKIVAGNQLAKLGVEAAELQQQMTERDLLEQVEESYWLVVGLQDKRRTLDRVTQLLDTVEHIVTTAVQSGLALETDLMQVEAKHAELNRQRIRLESGLVLATRALAQSIGIEQTGINCVVSDYADEASNMVTSESSGVGPEEELLALQTRAAELQRTMTIADALPKVAVGAHYGYNKLDANMLRNGLGGWNGAVFATMTVPLTGWWETGHKIKEQSIRLEEARLEQRDLSEKLFLRKQQAYDEMRVSEMLVTEAERVVELAARRCQLAETGYKAGTTSITDLLSTEIELLQAENELTDARISLSVHRRRYNDLRK